MTQPSSLACPSCDAYPLEHQDDHALLCTGCGTKFPVSAGLSWLFAQPDVHRFQWHLKFQQALASIETAAQNHAGALRQVDLPKSMHAKLTVLKDGYERQYRELKDIQQRLGLQEPADTNPALLSVLQHRVASVQHALSYNTNIFRDWVWGENEIKITNQILKKHLTDDMKVCAHAAVLGAGAGRLTADLAVSLPNANLYHVDINPLLTYVAKCCHQNAPLSLTEIVYQPLTAQTCAVEHQLEHQTGADTSSRIFHLLADVLRLPFQKKSLDLLVTPWLIDILDDSFENLARRWNQFLRDDGLWVNFGPLSFENQPPANRPSHDAILEALENNGFQILQAEFVETPYLNSPYSAQSRFEKVFCFSARKKSQAKPVKRHEAYPEWMLNPDLPLPAPAPLVPLQARRGLEAHLLHLLTTSKTLSDVIKGFAQATRLSHADAERTVMTLLSNMMESGEIVSK